MRALPILALLGVALADPVAARAGTRRFALVAGANDGGTDRVELRYAITDAMAMGDVLADLGGIPISDQRRLTEPDAEGLAGAIRSLSELVKRAEDLGDRTEVVFYYSGHSDESGLLLGNTHYPYPALKADLEAVPSDLKVVILDSCASGALVRTKGGVARPAFLQDRTNDVEGTAYVMSSAADEASQESDVVGASYFTHFLVSGLRGAADRSTDGRVTLHEAWDFAARETLERTERTSIGAQHPFFHRDLGGHGDFVFTDLTRTTSSLVFEEGLTGRLFVRDADGDLVAELSKPEGEGVEVALAPGTYTIVLQQDAARSEAVLEIGTAEHLLVGDLEFYAIEAETVRARGRAPVAPPVAAPAIAAVPRPSLPSPSRPPASPSILPGDGALGIGVITVGGRMGLQLGAIGSEATSAGIQSSSFYNSTGELRAVQLSAGLNLVRARGTGWQSGMLNVATGEMTGAQTGLINSADALVGVQAGVVNHSREARGVQVGVVNTGGDGAGLQVGLVNVAGDYDGVAVGLINIHRKGYNHVFLSAGSIEATTLTGTLGSRYLYSHVQAGTRYWPGNRVSILGGFGVHVPLQRLYIDTDVGVGFRGGSARRDDRQQGGYGLIVRSRLNLGVSFGERFGFQTGPVLEFDPRVAGGGDDPNPSANRDAIRFGWAGGMRF